MHSYIGAVISMVILLLTVDHWTFDVVAFPLFVACVASVESVLIGLELGPRFRRLPSSWGRLGRAGGGNDALSPAAW